MYSDDIAAVYIDYYSFDNQGTKTIAIHHTPGVFADKTKNYAVLGNGGVPLWILSDEELAQVARLCIQKGITISPIIVH